MKALNNREILKWAKGKSLALDRSVKLVFQGRSKRSTRKLRDILETMRSNPAETICFDVGNDGFFFKIGLHLTPPAVPVMLGFDAKSKRAVFHLAFPPMKNPR